MTDRRWQQRYTGSEWYGRANSQFEKHTVEVDWIKRDHLGYPEPMAIRVFLPGNFEAWLEWSEDDSGWQAMRVGGQFDADNGSSLLAGLHEAWPLVLGIRQDAGRRLGSTNYPRRAVVLRQAEDELIRRGVVRTIPNLATEMRLIDEDMASLDEGTLARWIRNGDVVVQQ
jgi:hypothetical protein